MSTDAEDAELEATKTAWLTELGRRLPTGEIAVVYRFIFTYGLLVGATPDTYRTRFCYQSLPSAVAALLQWDGRGDPPGPWIKEKGRTERSNPNLKGIPIKEEKL